MTRAEKRLVSIGLLVIAAGILYETIRMPGADLTSSPQTDPVSTVSTAVSRYAVNINEATVEELAGVRGISEDMAKRIVDDRNENGRFSSVEDIMRVQGIGQATYEKLRAYIKAE